MADYSSYRPTTDSTDYVTKLDNHITATQSVATEVENAREGQANLLANLNLKEDAFLVSAPANADSAGTAGQWAWDTGFIYVCVATNTWKRVAIATW